MKHNRLIKLGKKHEIAPRESGYPFFSLEGGMNRLFDEFFHGFDLEPFRLSGEKDWFNTAVPKIDVTETEDEIHVEAEVPGMDEKDIEVNLSDNMLTISGEKKLEHEDKKKDFYRMERSYGSFHRAIPIYSGVDVNKIKAALKKGELTVTLPKTAEAKKS